MVLLFLNQYDNADLWALNLPRQSRQSLEDLMPFYLWSLLSSSLLLFWYWASFQSCSYFLDVHGCLCLLSALEKYFTNYYRDNDWVLFCVWCLRHLHVLLIPLTILSPSTKLFMKLYFQAIRNYISQRVLLHLLSILSKKVS